MSHHVDFKAWYHCQAIKIRPRTAFAIVKKNRCQDLDNAKILQLRSFWSWFRISTFIFLNEAFDWSTNSRYIILFFFANADKLFLLLISKWK